MDCPFCKNDPYHYVDIGVGMQPVAINCCDAGVDYFSRDAERNRVPAKILRLRQSGSVRRLIRSDALLLEHYGETRH